MTRLPFGRQWIGPDEPVFIIAEIGVNHEGDAKSCLEHIRAAADAGATAVKLQTVDPAEHYPPMHQSFALFQRSRLSRSATEEAFGLARSLGVEPFTTVGFSDLPWISDLKPEGFKVSSGLLTHTPLVRALAATGRTLIVSTGMSEVDDIDDAVEVARQAGCIGPVVLQCTSLYPAPLETLSLRTIGWLANRYGSPSGLSDHTTSELVPALAVAAGACVIEKHFSLTPDREGFDHAISLGPQGFARMVTSVRHAEAARGQFVKRLGPQEAEMATRMRRAVVARRPIARGARISREDVQIMRSQDGVRGIPPKDLEATIGRAAAVDIAQWATLTRALLA